MERRERVTVVVRVAQIVAVKEAWKGREGGCVYTCKMSSIGWRCQCKNSKRSTQN